MTEQEEYLQNTFLRLGVTLSDLQRRQFLRYAKLLTQWNEKINLTAITDFEGIVQKHFADSCAVILFPEEAERLRKASLIDVGTGAGFPGIPLKILFPELKVCLLDSLQKRITFLDAVVAELKLTGVQTVHARAEEGAQMSEHREQYDVCVSRAVARLAVLSEYTLPYLKVGGRLLAYKGSDVAEECSEAGRAVKLLGGKMMPVKQFILPGTDYGRSLVKVEKLAHTPKAYPRKAGTAAKNPLI